MNNWTKRMLAAVLTLLMVMQCAPLAVFASATEETQQTEALMPTEETTPEATEETLAPTEPEQEAEETLAPTEPEQKVEETTQPQEPTEETDAPDEEAFPEESVVLEADMLQTAAVQPVLQNGTAVIPAGSTVEQVTQILNKTLITNLDAVDTADIQWEYECKGKNGLLTNTAWGSIRGFTSTKKVGFATTKYTHPALADNDDDIYLVRIAGTNLEATLTKSAKRNSTIVLKKNCSAAIPHNADGSTDFALLKSRLFETVVASSDPDLTANDVVFTYFATPSTGAAGDFGKKWVALEGERGALGALGVSYPAISAGSQEIKITWNGNEAYCGSERQTIVTLTERAEAVITLKADQTVSIRGMSAAADILSWIVEESTVTLSADNAVVEYYDAGIAGIGGAFGSWKTLTELQDGKYSIRVVFQGDTEYQKAVSNTVDVTFVSKDSSGLEMKEGPYSVKMTYTEAVQADIPALKAAIWEAVAASSTPNLSADQLVFTYQASATDGALGSNVKAWVGLEGGKVNLVPYPAISIGTHKINIRWEGNDDFYGFEKEVTVTLTEREQAPYTRNPSIDTVKLVVDDDLNTDYDAVAKAVFHAVIAESDVLTQDNVTVEYYYKGYTSLDTQWLPLAGKDVVGDKGFPAVSAGSQKVRILWKGNRQYADTVIEANVVFADRPEAPYTKNTVIAPVTLVVDDALNTDYAAITQAVFDAVISSSEVLTADNVEVKYYYKGLTAVDSQWLPLDGKDLILGQGFPAVSAGTHEVRILWNGSKEYAPTAVQATVTFADRPTVNFHLNKGPYEVGLAFADVNSYDYEATAKGIFEAVVERTENPEGLTASDVTVEYNVDKTGLTPLYKSLADSDPAGLVKFGAGSWKIRISWAGTKDYKGGSVIADVAMTDNRLESKVVLKSGVSFTYNMDVTVMKDTIFASVIDWENSTLPSREELSLADFVIEYQASLQDIESGAELPELPDIPGITDKKLVPQWVPVEGKKYEIGGTVLGQYPQMGAGEQKIRVRYVGNAEYRPSDGTEGTVTVNKASVSVKVKTLSLYVDEALPANFVTTNPADRFDIYTISAGVTSNVTTAVYLNLPGRYQSNVFVKILDPIAQKLYGKTFTQMMNDGMTLGELRKLLSTQELLDLLKKLNIDTGTFGQILTVINKLPAVTDSVRVSFGYPNRAGMYLVTAVTDNKNYNTGVGAGVLVLKMRLSGSKLTWNEKIPGGKLTAAEAAAFDFGATLSYNGDVTVNQEGVRYLYSGVTSKWKPYSSTTTPPTQPGRYAVTVCIIGGNHLAAPLTRSFQITK